MRPTPPSLADILMQQTPAAITAVFFDRERSAFSEAMQLPIYVG
jgi:hypothetical protein